jgi:hypothetical protein
MNLGRQTASLEDIGYNHPSHSEVHLGQFKSSGSSMLVSMWTTLGLAVALPQPRAFGLKAARVGFKWLMTEFKDFDREFHEEGKLLWLVGLTKCIEAPGL